MTTLVLLAVGILVAGFVLRAFVRTQPADLARRLKMAGGVALMALGGGLLFFRNFALGVPVGAAGLMIFRRSMTTPTSGGPERTSTVRSAGLEMILNLETGEMDGRLLAGRCEGRRLSELRLDELLDIASELRGDADSLRLLESYLDRAHPAWRDDVQADKSDRHGAAAGTGGMDAQEAYEILGLEPHAGETEVREAHRRLMKQVHPDRGGTAALAARINEAKDRILGKHR